MGIQLLRQEERGRWIWKYRRYAHTARDREINRGRGSDRDTEIQRETQREAQRCMTRKRQADRVRYADRQRLGTSMWKTPRGEGEVRGVNGCGVERAPRRERRKSVVRRGGDQRKEKLI